MIPQIWISMGKQVCQQGTTLNQNDTKEQHAKQYTRTKQRHDTRLHGSSTNIYYKASKIDIQDHKAIMNKVASLPWFSHKYIQERTRGQENSLYMCTKAFKSHPKRCGEPSCLDLLTGRDQAHPTHVLQPRLHTCTQGDKKARALDSKGLASTYLGIKYLVTRVSGAHNLSCGLAWCKCRLEWKIFRAPLEPCLKEVTREESRVLPQAKRQRSFGVVGEEPRQAPLEACRAPMKDRLGDQRGGEWMGADKNSPRRRLKLRQDELARSNPQNHTLRTSTFRLPKPRSHWSATGPRNKHY
jgi:hypothetical protein